MALDQRHHIGRRFAQFANEARSRLVAQQAAYVLWRQPQPGIDETDIPARPAIADFLRFQDPAVDPNFRCMQGCRQPSETAAHDGEIGPHVAVHRRSVIVLVCRPVPKRYGGPVCHAPRDRNV